MEKIVSIFSDNKIISKIQATELPDITLSSPIQALSPSDVLDAPLNPDGLQEGIEIIKVLLESSMAIFSFAAALRAILKETRGKAVIRNGDIEKIIDAETPIVEIEESFSK